MTTSQRLQINDALILVLMPSVIGWLKSKLRKGKPLNLIERVVIEDLRQVLQLLADVETALSLDSAAREQIATGNSVSISQPTAAASTSRSRSRPGAASNKRSPATGKNSAIGPTQVGGRPTTK